MASPETEVPWWPYYVQEENALASLRGFLKLGNLVVRLTFPFIDLPKKATAWIERPPQSLRPDPPPAASSATGSSAHTRAVSESVSTEPRRQPPAFGRDFFG
jgi:hypothetical protein